MPAKRGTGKKGKSGTRKKPATKAARARTSPSAMRVASLVSDLVDGPALLYEREAEGGYRLTGHAKRPRGKARELARVKGPEARVLRGWDHVPVARERRRVGILAYRPAKGASRVSKAKLKSVIQEAFAGADGEAKPAREKAAPEPSEFFALLSAGHALASHLNVEDLMKRLAGEVHKLTNVSGVYVAFADAEKQQITFPLLLVDGNAAHQAPRPMGKGLTEHVFSTGEPLLIPQDFEKTRKAMNLDKPRVKPRSWLAVPIRRGDDVLGVLGIFDTEREGAVSKRHVPLLSVLAGHLAVALQNADLFKRLNESQVRYRAVAEAAGTAQLGLGILDSERGRPVRFVFVNEALAHILGASPGEAEGRPILEFVPDADRPRVERLQRDWFKGRFPTRAFEINILRSDASVVPIEVSLGPATVADRLQAVMFVRDISERKAAEKALHAQKEVYERLLMAQSDLGEGILETRGEGVEYANAAYCRMSGYTLDELIALPSLMALIPPEDRNAHMDRLRRRLAGEDVPDHYEGAILKKDGSRVEVEVALKLLEKDPEPHFITIVRDVTERKRTEALYQSVVETAAQAKEGVAILQDTPEGVGRFIYANEEFARITGLAPDRLIGMTFPEILPPETHAQVREIYAARSRGDESVPVTYETSVLRGDGTRLPVEISAGITTIGGALTHVAFVKDISERKAAEAKLLQLKNLMQEIVDNVPAGVLYMDASGLIIFENRYLLRLMGAEADDSPKGWFTRIFDLPNVKENPAFVEALEGLLGGKPFRDLEFVHNSLYGREVTIFVSGVPMMERGADGETPEPKGGILLIRDATEERMLRRKLEEHARNLEETVEERTQALREANAALASANLNLETIYNATIDGFLFVDKDRNLVSCNKRFCEIFGYGSVGEVLATAPEEIRRRGKARMKDPAYFDATYSLYEPEKLHLTYDGEVELTGPVERRIHEHSEPIFDEKGEYQGRVWTYRDVTEQRLLQEALAERGQLLTTILENTTEGVFALGPDGTYLFCNRRHAELMGYGDASVVGRSLFDGFPEAQAARYRSRIEEALEGRRTVAVEVSFVNLEGRELHLLWHVQPLMVDGRFIQAVGTVTDLTDRKRLEEELIQYTKMLEDEVEKRTQHLIEAEKMAALGQLVAGVAHEINNPLAYVKSNTETIREVTRELLDQPDVAALLGGDLTRVAPAMQWLSESANLQFLTEQQPHLLDMNMKGLNRIGDIVLRLKSIASPQAMKKVPTDFNGFLRDTAHIFHAQFKNRIELAESYDGNLPPVHCDGGMVSQVAMNLLVNAAQAIPSEGRVAISTKREGRYAVFTVEDDGSGMTPEVRARIFDPFYTTKDKGNTGLGLPISFKIVKEHGGDVSVKSEPGKGTTFTVRIPIEERQ